MTYFNGSLHGFNSSKGFIPPVPVTKIYCDACAVEEIPLDYLQPPGQEHYNSDFRWVGQFGAKCSNCGEVC